MPDGCAHLTDNQFGGISFSVNFGGIIMSDATGANAMGVYGVSVGQAGSVSYFAMFKFFCWGDGPIETASDTTAGAPYMQPEQFPRAKLLTTCT
jgi:hypothetical protein